MVGKKIKKYLPTDLPTWSKTIIVIAVASAVGVMAKFSGLLGRLRGGK